MNTRMGTVTIGVPVYNGASTLRRALECLRNQTYQDIKVIISDNASTDESARIAQEFVDADARFTLIQQKTNIGAMPNFFYLLQIAQSEFFMWRADDDWSDNNYVEELVTLLACQPDAILATSEVVTLRPTGEVVERKSFSISPWPLRVLKVGHVLMGLGASSIYGIWRKPAIEEILARTRIAYPYVWAWDHLTMFPAILSGHVLGTNNTRLYVGRPEAPRYSFRESAKVMWEMRRSFRHACLGELDRLEWTWWERPILMIFVWRYANLRVYRFWKTVRRQIRDLTGAKG